jgi:hypothetical protein
MWGKWSLTDKNAAAISVTTKGIVQIIIQTSNTPITITILDIEIVALGRFPNPPQNFSDDAPTLFPPN